MNPLMGKILDVDKRQKFIYSLMYYDGEGPFFITDLEEYAGYDNPQQDLRKVINYLIEIDIIVFVEKIKGYSRYRLDKKELEKLIRSCGIFSTNGKFIQKTKPMSYNF